MGYINYYEFDMISNLKKIIKDYGNIKISLIPSTNEFFKKELFLYIRWCSITGSFCGSVCHNCLMTKKVTFRYSFSAFSFLIFHFSVFCDTFFQKIEKTSKRRLALQRLMCCYNSCCCMLLATCIIFWWIEWFQYVSSQTRFALTWFIFIFLGISWQDFWWEKWSPNLYIKIKIKIIYYSTYYL